MEIDTTISASRQHKVNYRLVFTFKLTTYVIRDLAEQHTVYTTSACTLYVELLHSNKTGLYVNNGTGKRH